MQVLPHASFRTALYWLLAEVKIKHNNTKMLESHCINSSGYRHHRWGRLQLKVMCQTQENNCASHKILTSYDWRKVLSTPQNTAKGKNISTQLTRHLWLFQFMLIDVVLYDIKVMKTRSLSFFFLFFFKFDIRCS